MSAFNDPDLVETSLKRIASFTGRSVDDFVVSAALDSSRPDQAVVYFERWLKATSSPETFVDSVLSVPQLGRLLVTLLGASHQIADVLVQNPELAGLVLDPAELASRPDPLQLATEIEAMVANSTSYKHALDRIRFFRQAWHVRIAAADIGGIWNEESVWTALADVADACLLAACNVVWKHVSQQRSITSPCPVSVVAFGKLGGQELNFSSDIDLVYLLDDDASPELETHAVRYAETLTRALSDRMGRGSLYRVDLRLRPYGGRGPLVPRMAAIEGYYAKYAESWEQLALVRSRVVVGTTGCQGRWDKLREATCFHTKRGEWFVQDLLHMRSRIEERHDSSDIKRGVGGIRDVEFLTQILQVLFGAEHPGIRVRQTCRALRALVDSGIVKQHTAEELIAAYTFLRQVEHRIQILGDRQWHSVPEDDFARLELARRSGFASLHAFDMALQMHREHARNHYGEFLLTNDEETTSREEIQARSGDDGALVSYWIDDLPAPGAFYESLLENESSLKRLVTIAKRAPALVPYARRSVAMTEQAMSGEILEEQQRVPPKLGDVQTAAKTIRTAWLRNGLLAVLQENFDYGKAAALAADHDVVAIAEHCLLEASIIALGSYGGRELGLHSDLDILFYSDTDDSAHVERGAQASLSLVQALRRAGAPIEWDLRLRPEGKKGRLVQSRRLLEQYEETTMEPWERLALGRARAVRGEVPPIVRKSAFGRPLDAPMLESLFKMKRRVETERVPVQFRNRHIKLGPGGQDDVLWTVGVLWWKHADILDLSETSVEARLSQLFTIRAINAVEKDLMSEAWRFLVHLRLQLALLGYSDEVLPENPDKLDRIAMALGFSSGNEVIRTYEGHADALKGNFKATMGRLES